MPDISGLSTLVALIESVTFLVMDGATYKPAGEMVPYELKPWFPVGGTMVHVTLEESGAVTVAVNCWLWDAERATEPGLTVTDIVTPGVNEMVALADFVGSAALVAVTVTVCEALMLDGAE